VTDHVRRDQHSSDSRAGLWGPLGLRAPPARCGQRGAKHNRVAAQAQRIARCPGQKGAKKTGRDEEQQGRSPHLSERTAPPKNLPASGSFFSGAGVELSSCRLGVVLRSATFTTILAPSHASGFDLKCVRHPPPQTLTSASILVYSQRFVENAAVFTSRGRCWLKTTL
jgi:hypothetical protein